jgi:nucleotide-binding universal stress UspA family protein
MATAKNDAGIGHNVPTIDELYADRIETNRPEIEKGLADLDKHREGTEGYAVARAATDKLALNIDELAAWQPDAATNKMEVAVSRAQADVVEAKKNPRTYEQLRDALLAAVCASSKEIAEQARVGDGTREKPQYKVVRVRQFCSPDDVKPFHFVGTEADAAKTIADKLAQHASDPDPTFRDIWTQADRAVDKVPELRVLAARVAAMTTALKRWRDVLYAHVVIPLVDEYVADETKTETVGRVWPNALMKAREAHTDFIAAKIKAGTALPLNDADKASLNEAINAAVNKYLDQYRGGVVKGATILDDDQIQKKVREALFRALREADKHWGEVSLLAIVKGAISTMPLERGLFDPKDRDIAKRFEKLVGQTSDAQDEIEEEVEAELDEAAKAKQQRALEREAKKNAPPATAPGKPGNKPAPRDDDAASKARIEKMRQRAK